MAYFVEGPIVISATMFALQYLASEARRAKGRRVGESYLYPSARGVELIYSVAIAAGTGFLFFSIRQPEGDRLIGVICSLILILIGILAWPKAVWLSPSGLRQRAWYGRWKILPWEDVTEVVDEQDRSVIVRGKRTKIVFSPFHAEREAFIKDVHRHQFSHAKVHDSATTPA
jgi:4-amino-4-deoxy-L-arabinose transferase-like glycosyltransferase